MTVISCRTSYVPVSSTFGTTGNRHILTRFCFQILRFIPVDSHILNELERVHETFIIFRYIGSHLQRAVHRDIKCQLTCQGSTCMLFVIRIHLAAVRFKNTRSIIHRTTNQTCKRKNSRMVHIISAKRFVFCTTC